MLSALRALCGKKLNIFILKNVNNPKTPVKESKEVYL